MRQFCNAFRFFLGTVFLAAFLPACAGNAVSPPAGPTGAPPHPIQLSPESLAFTSDAPQSVQISQPGFTGKYTDQSLCTGIATATFYRNGSGEAELVVIPVGKGHCVVHIFGGDFATAKLTVSVTPSAVIVAPPSLTFTTTGHESSRNVALAQSGFSRHFVHSDNCSGIAAISTVSNESGHATFAVAPVAKGTCTVVFAGGLKETASLFVSVEPLGVVNVDPASLAFTTTGSSAAREAKVTQDGYNGSFTESDTCKGVATIHSSSNANGKATYVVTPAAKGDCVATFGGNGHSAPLSISVAPAGAVLVDPSSLQFNETNAASAQIVVVSQSGFEGSFKESDTCSGIATVIEATSGKGKAKYRVTPVAKGTCTATFSGAHGESGPLAIAVTPPGSVLVAPASLTFDTVGAGGAKNAAVSQADYTGTFAESDNCNGIATVVAASNAGGHAAYTVTPVAGGKCTATFSGGNAATAPLAIDVTPPAPGDVVVDPTSLSFTATGPDAAANAAISQAHYDGAFTEKDDCAGIASVSAKSNAGGKASFTVTPLTKGDCAATFTGGGSKSAPLAISSAPLGEVVVMPSSLTFVSAGSPSAKDVAISQKGFGGAYTESDTCASIATVSERSNGKGGASYTVTAVANGDCVATFTGGNKHSAPLSIAVAIPAPRPVVVTPNSLTFTSTGSGAVKNVTVTQSNFGGSFTQTNTCSGIATIAAIGSSGRGTFQVTPIAKGTCTATFHGADGESAPLAIEVSPPGSVVVNPGALVFTTTGPAQSSVAVSQSGFSGSFTESDNCSGIATVVAHQNGSGQATYKVAAVAKGACTATFRGNPGVSGALSISVNPPGRVVADPSAPHFLSLGSTGAKFTDISQTGYAGHFTESNTCAGIATIAQESSTQGHAVFKVTALTKGQCAATFTGGNNQTARVSVLVATLAPGPVAAIPGSLDFARPGIGFAKRVLVGQLLYGGSFTVSGCNGIASLTASTNTDGAAAYRVVPVARGSCAATFTGGGGRLTRVPIVVR